MANEKLENTLLLALPIQDGTYFEKTLIYLCTDSDGGTLGYVVNRPLELKLQDVYEVANIESERDSELQVLAGGPVAIRRMSIIHEGDYESDGSVTMPDGLKLTMHSDEQPIFNMLRDISMASGPERFLVLFGYAGWGEGQLEQELKQNAWITCPNSRELLFDKPYPERYDVASKSIGVDMDLITARSGNA